MDSIICMNEVVKNADRRFGANLEYYPCYIETEDGERAPALFTLNDLETAMERAERNPEDIPHERSFWDFLLGG